MVICINQALNDTTNAGFDSAAKIKAGIRNFYKSVFEEFFVLLRHVIKEKTGSWVGDKKYLHTGIIYKADK